MNFKLFVSLALLLFLCNAHALAQTPVSGIVTDSAGNPLQSASIQVKGTKVGAVTGANGRFTITVPANASTLLISSVGYASQEVAVSPSLVISLKSNSSILADVVVIGYGTVRKKDLTGAISTVGQKDFQRGTITSPDQLIAGKVAGVQVISNSGAPGAGSTIRIRGGASLNATNDPLIVIDGVPLTGDGLAGVANPLAMINPDDIESFSIAKDAASTAIYGSRASNGVIFITTKKGKKGPAKFSFSTVNSLGTIAKELDVLSGEEMRKYVNDAAAANPTAYGAYPALLGQANTDWQKEIFQNAFTTNNTLSITGSTKNIPYRVSVGYLNQDGILKTDNLQRATGSIALTPMLFDNHLKIDINVKGAYSESDFAQQGAIGSAVRFDPTQAVSDAKGDYFEWKQANGTYNSLSTPNPVAQLNQNHSTGKTLRSIGNIQLDYKLHFLPDLHANVNLGYDASDGHGNFNSEDSARTANSTYNYRGTQGEYQEYKTYTFFEGYLNYIKDFASINSNLNAIGGYGYYNNHSAKYNFYSFFLNNDTVPGTKPSAPLNLDYQTLLSYYARAIFTVNNKYIFAGSVRTDGSSRFAKENRWGVFPSGAFTWRINNEDFLKSSSVISDLKLRLSYGVTGQQDGIGYYNYLPAYFPAAASSQYQLGNSFYQLYSPAVYAADIRWEQTSAYNIGVDFAFFKNRFSGSVDVYQKKTKDLLNTYNIPVGTNFSNQITDNIGDMDTKGVEVTLNVTPVQSANWHWDLSYNFSYNKREITKLSLNDDPSFKGNTTGGISGATGQTIQINSVGYTPNSFFVFKQVYDEKTGAPIEGLYDDQNRDGVINDNDKYRYKSPYAPYTMGLTSNLTYKDWSLNMVFRSNIGNYLYNNVQSDIGVTRNILNPLVFIQNAPVEALQTGFVNNQYQSDYYIENASFLKLDNIGLSYNAGKVFNNKVGLILGANCQNVFVITKYTGIDPEIYLNRDQDKTRVGIDNVIYPRARTFSVSVNLNF
jgi:TonB-linked SusC/RagA family outer membrane protein